MERMKKSYTQEIDVMLDRLNVGGGDVLLFLCLFSILL